MKQKNKKQSPLINPFDENNIKPKKHWKIKTTLIVVLGVAVIIGLNIFFNRFYLVSPIIFQNPIRNRGSEYPINIKKSEFEKIILNEIDKQCPIDKIDVVKPRENDVSVKKDNQQVWTGQASIYTEDGCLGCDENLIMANGEKLDDTKLTIAMLPEVVNQYKLLNDKVKITNEANGLFVEARITDTGGFGKYNRIADLNKATAEAINCKGLCQVKVELI